MFGFQVPANLCSLSPRTQRPPEDRGAVPAHHATQVCGVAGWAQARSTRHSTRAQPREMQAPGVAPRPTSRSRVTGSRAREACHALCAATNLREVSVASSSSQKARVHAHVYCSLSPAVRTLHDSLGAPPPDRCTARVHARVVTSSRLPCCAVPPPSVVSAERPLSLLEGHAHRRTRAHVHVRVLMLTTARLDTHQRLVLAAPPATSTGAASACSCMASTTCPCRACRLPSRPSRPSRGYQRPSP